MKMNGVNDRTRFSRHNIACVPMLFVKVFLHNYPVAGDRFKAKSAATD